MREELNDPRVNPRLAADLGKLKDEKAATDLSKEAIKGRDRARRMESAAKWAKQMSKVFKGIRGTPTRSEYITLAIKRDPVLKEEYENEGD